MKYIKLVAQIIFYLLVLLIYLGRAVHWGFSHDENQFIAAGQLLAYHGILPYINYPYTHMPYGAIFYGITAGISSYDYFAGRILNAIAWVICGLLIVQILKQFWGSRVSFALFIWEFAIVFIFINHPSMTLIAGEALNHSLSSLFSLAALLFFIQFTQQNKSSFWTPFWCGVCISMASFIRFNYASLIVILVLLFLLHKLIFKPPLFLRSFITFIAGVVTASLPALALILLAPNSFYYGNLVYTRLNTIYYQELLFRSNMEMVGKIKGFLFTTVSTPISLILYVLLILVGIYALIKTIKQRSLMDLNNMAVAGFAFTLFLTAFTPTPTQQQYYFAPLPFMIIILGIVGYQIYRKIQWLNYLVIVGLLIALNPSMKITDPLADVGYLSRPSQWVPLQVHTFAEEIKDYVPKGRILTLIPMIPMEAGFESYPFTTTGPFSWRTSLLLTPQRRAQYGIISPEELPALLQQFPPDGILTGFETPYDGFKRNDQGGLETPFIDYAKKNGYKPIVLPASFVYRPITLWVKQP